jgi:prepilin-type N-terminal cleavage/methylation domain-containing protein
MIKGNKKGFTLTETMVVVVVFAGVMSLSLAVFLASIRTQRFALHQQRLVTETTYALKRVEEKVRDGEEVKKQDVNNYIENIFTSSFVTVENPDNTKVIEQGDRITILIETKAKVDEGRDVILKLQTTIMNRE